jgi:5,10-methylenetetrahydromethanopterin reductase
LNPFEISIAFQTNKRIDEYGPLARQVENLDFDGVTVYNDMLYQPAWLPLLEIARNTKKIRIGPASVNPFTSHPLNIAGNIAIIDECSHGQAYLGLARGTWLDYVGVKPKNPINGLKEAMGCIRHLLKKSTDIYPSNYFPLKGGDSFHWKILRSDIPFLLGSWGPKTIQACIHEISEVKLGGTANSDVVPWIQTQIKNAALKSGRDASTIGMVFGAVSVVDQDGDKARVLARKEVARYLPIVASLDPTIELDVDLIESIQKAASKNYFSEASEFIDDDLLERFAFAGTPEEITKQTLNLFNAGVHRVEFGTPHGLTTEYDGLELIGKEVLPIIKEKLAIKN